MESDSREADDAESTTLTMNPDLYEDGATVASDGRFWLGEDWAGKDIEIAVREKGE